ncbi:N-acetylglucosamine-6-phosphate deacetylase [Algibacillus agarilyticus]|uniref:N-acetylglucosamine-6-phosphate deacetylase n=1 Tax=Algibacillus agarilyticus TaxID=2234133 RepID=UPI000DD0864D|nr:N-acetylglucosamine-6-phosphate deacetylase [Algibacillus agarilyticus]
MSTHYIAETLFDGDHFHHHLAFSVTNGKISQLGGEPHKNAIALLGTVTAGFIDVQVNGGGGKLFNHAPCIATLKAMMQAHGSLGTTGMLPTLITDQLSVIEAAADTVAKAIKTQLPGILGIHFEGPHLSQPKRGVHASQYIRPLSSAEMQVYERNDLGIKIVTVAPENVSPADIKKLVTANVKVCLGHSNADYATTMAALEAGATGFTHLFNAMSPLQSREPGMTGAALLHADSWCGIIMDGHHVHPASAQLALKSKAEKIMLVTDAMSPVGTDKTHFDFFGGKVVREGSKLTTVEGVLAGSVLDMIGAVKYCVETLNLPLAQALRMASTYPANFLGLSQKRGKLTIGHQADFVVFNHDYEITQRYINGIKQV